MNRRTPLDTLRATCAAQGRRLRHLLAHGRSRELHPLHPDRSLLHLLHLRRLRRLLGPIVAASAGLLLLWLIAVGAVSFATFVLAGALIGAILTYVFGLKIGVNTAKMGL